MTSESRAPQAEIDAEQQGFEVGRRGGHDRECRYDRRTKAGKAWIAGWREGLHQWIDAIGRPQRVG